MNDQCTEDRFLRDVSEHEMTIVRDDGVSRHIRFKKPRTNCYFFDLITWPGHLCVSGDCGTYVFSRLDDMFEFFRVDRTHSVCKDRQLYINKQYWAEKVVSECRHGGIKEYSEDKFRAQIKDYFDQHFQDEIEEEVALRADATDEDPLHPNELQEMVDAAAKRAELWKAIEDEVLSCADDEHQAGHAAYHF